MWENETQKNLEGTTIFMVIRIVIIYSVLIYQ